MRRVIIFFVSCLFFLFFSLRSAFAVSVAINNPPSIITTDPFTLSVLVSGASPGTNYLRVDIFKNDTTNYFGETFTGADWYGGSDGAQYLPITIGSDKTWQGSVQARIGDTIPKDYDGTGTYRLRIRRYTAGGNYSNDEAKASAVPVVLLFPTFTPVPTNTLTPTPTLTPTHSASSGSATTTKASDTPKPTNTQKPTSTKPLLSITRIVSQSPGSTEVASPVALSPTETANDASNSGLPLVATKEAVLAAEVSSLSSNTPLPTTLVEGITTASSFSLPFIFAGLGGLCLVACGILVYWKVHSTKFPLPEGED